MAEDDAGVHADWQLECDVLVVGGGCAGTAAAIEAARADAEVLVLDRSGGGGASAMSGGLLYLGGGTPIQRACGFDDEPEEMFKFLMAATGPGADEAKIEAYCTGSLEHFDWLVDCGVPFNASFYDGLLSEPPGDEGLMFSGGEDAYPFDGIAVPAPRGHVPQMPGADKVVGERGAGWMLMQCLSERASELGVKSEQDVRVDDLVVDPSGRVTGVVGRKYGREVRVRARRGVVLAGGGFACNDEMLAQHAPRMVGHAPVGTDGDDGSVIRMAQAHGAAVRNMHATTAYAVPSPLLVRSVFVDMHGQRFINEDTYFGRIGEAAMFQRDGQAVLIVDEEGFEAVPEPERFGRRPEWVCETVEELESELGMPTGSLQWTIRTYNEGAERGEDPWFHKHPRYLKPLRSPFGAIDFRARPHLSAGAAEGEGARYGFFTLGGLRTTPLGEVLDVRGSTMPGLFAAGRSTAGVPATSYVSGCSLGDSTFFGRRAGKQAAAR